MKNSLLITLSAVLLFGCKKTRIEKCCNGAPQLASIDSSVIAMPDVFTPNGDGVNDQLRVLTRNISSLKITIKKSFGRTVFESTDLYIGWGGIGNGGKEEREKKYSYTLEAITNLGKTLSLSGEVCLIRDNCAKGDMTKCFFETQFNGFVFDGNISNSENIKECN